MCTSTVLWMTAPTGGNTFWFGGVWLQIHGAKGLPPFGSLFPTTLVSVVDVTVLCVTAAPRPSYRGTLDHTEIGDAPTTLFVEIETAVGVTSMMPMFASNCSVSAREDHDFTWNAMSPVSGGVENMSSRFGYSVFVPPTASPALVRSPIVPGPTIRSEGHGGAARRS